MCINTLFGIVNCFHISQNVNVSQTTCFLFLRLKKIKLKKIFPLIKGQQLPWTVIKKFIMMKNGVRSAYFDFFFFFS